MSAGRIKLQRLGILLSGRGSNFVAIAEAIAAGALGGCEIAVVVSNREEAPGLEAARARGMATAVAASKGADRGAHDARMVEILRAHGADWVVLAGYMRVLTAGFLGAFPGRVLNIHPSLLPSFPGLGAQRQALAYGVKVAGCTVHFVDEAVDHGAIVLQRAVPVMEGDTEATLSARILVEEHRAYPEALRMVLGGGYRVVGRRFSS